MYNMEIIDKMPRPISLDTRLVHKPFAAIIDLDGTIARAGEREIFYLSEPRNFRAAEHAVHFDEVKTEVLNEIYRILGSNQNESIFSALIHFLVLTAREGNPTCFKNSKLWLDTNKIKHTDLYMRKIGDMSKDFDSKRERLHEIQKEYDVVAVFDDNDGVLQMFLDENIPYVFKVDDNKVRQVIMTQASTIELMDTF